MSFYKEKETEELKDTWESLQDEPCSCHFAPPCDPCVRGRGLSLEEYCELYGNDEGSHASDFDVNRLMIERDNTTETLGKKYNPLKHKIKPTEQDRIYLALTTLPVQFSPVSGKLSL